MKKAVPSIIGILVFFSIPLFCNAENINDAEIKTELIAAELYCFSLERTIFEFRDNFKSRSDVYEFFRQGFGPSISEKLTDNIWSGSQVRLKGDDKILEFPKDVKFKSITKNSAIIVFRTPNYRKHIWGNSEITELVFKREGNHWKLFQKD